MKKALRRAACLAVVLCALAAFIPAARYPLVTGAREYVAGGLEYCADYVAGGYPPKGTGVCADVVWAAFERAGYDLKSMLDEDIQSALSLYPATNGLPDNNIDFRRVENLRVFFSRHALALPVELGPDGDWRPGDIVVYSGHIAIVSDRRGASGNPLIIHHAGDGAREADELASRPILYHYRWTA